METEMNSPTIKIAIGKITVEYTGSQDFIENGLLELIESAVDKTANIPETLTNEGNSAASPAAGHSGGIQHMSTNTLATHIGAKSGPDLVMAAVAHIQLVLNKDKVRRADIATEMKNATTYYKTTYSSNFTAYLDNLVKGKRLNLVGEKTYALTAAERANMEQVLATA